MTSAPDAGGLSCRRQVIAALPGRHQAGRLQRGGWRRWPL